jgi:hypothetical protein
LSCLRKGITHTNLLAGLTRQVIKNKNLKLIYLFKPMLALNHL